MKAIKASNVISAKEYKDMTLEVLEFVGKTICKTLGPCANTSIIEEMGPLVASKDGFHTLQRIRFAPDDIFAQNILKVIMTMSHRMVNMVGDGSSSAVVAAWKFAERLNQMPKENTRPRELNENFKIAIEHIIDRIEKTAHHPSDVELPGIIYQTARISTNNDINFAVLMQEIYKKTHNNAIFNVEKARRGETETTYNIIDGYKANYYYMIDPIFHNQPGEFVGKNVNVACFDMAVDIHHYNMIQEMARIAHMRDEDPNNPNEVVIVAPSYSQNFLDRIKRDVDMDVQLMNAKQIRHFRIRYMRCLTTNVYQRNEYMDFCMLTGSTPITAADFNDMVDIMNSSEVFDVERLGQAIGKVDYLKTRNNEYAVINGFPRYNKERGDIVINQVRDTYDKLKAEAMNMRVPSTDFIRTKHRLNKLKCQMVELVVGAENEYEMSLKFDAAEDATLACESVAQYGWNVGGNMAIINAAYDLWKEESDDNMKAIYDVIQITFRDVLSEVFANKYTADGYDSLDGDIQSQIAEKITYCNEHKDEDIMYDLITGEYTKDVINSPQTDKEILRGAVSICLTLMTANQYISQFPNIPNGDPVEK